MKSITAKGYNVEFSEKQYTILNDLDISYKFFEEVINSMINEKLLEI